MRILFLLLISVAAMGQFKISDQQPDVEIQYNHENNSFKKKIFGKIEVDGHIVSDSVKFYVEADLFDHTIKDSKGNKYTARHCKKKDCKIIHLQECKWATSGTSTLPSPYYNLLNTPNEIIIKQ